MALKIYPSGNMVAHEKTAIHKTIFLPITDKVYKWPKGAIFYSFDPTANTYSISRWNFAEEFNIANSLVFTEFVDKDDQTFASNEKLQNYLDSFLDQISTNYFLEIAKGNIPGVSGFAIEGIDENIGTTEKTIGGLASGRYAFQTAVVAMEILSSDANDTSAGTGARTVLVSGVDGDFNRITSTKTLNGTTPVSLTGFMSINQTEVKSAGSGGSNAGKITTRVVSGSVEQSIIPVDSNISRDGAATLPAGFTAMLWTTVIFTEKGQDCVVRIYRQEENGLVLRRARLPTYQNSFVRNFKIPVKVLEKTRVEYTGVSENAGTSIQMTQQFELQDNSLVLISSIQQLMI